MLWIWLSSSGKSSRYATLPLRVVILQYQQSPLPKFGGNLHHSLSSLAEVLELTRQLFHLNSWCKLPLKSLEKSSQVRTAIYDDPTTRLKTSQSGAQFLSGHDENPIFFPSGKKLFHRAFSMSAIQRQLAIGSVASKNLGAPKALNSRNEGARAPI